MPKYKHLLLAIDIYEDCDALFKETKRLQNLYQAQLTVVHVTPHIISSMPYAYDFQDAIKTEANKRISEFKSKYQLQNDTVLIREGNPKREVADLAKKTNIDLIICGSHGKHGMELALGSTANGILHMAPCDVLTVRLNDEGVHAVASPYKNIVLATDLQEDNLVVIRAAKDLATQYKAQLHVIHVVGDVASLGYYPAIEIDLKGAAEKKLAEWAKKENLPVSSQQLHVKIGFPKQEILALADTVKAELIVIGSHARHGIGAALLGSTANSVLHGAQSDVLVVRV
jgi:universal stress protein A